MKMMNLETARRTLELERLSAELESANLWEAERKRLRGMDFYVPNKMQLRAHKSLARTILFCGGNRSGKSTFGAMELAFHLTKDYPSWYPLEKKFTRPIKAVVSATEFPIVTRVIEPKIFQYLPRDYYTVKRSPQGFLSRIVCKDSSTVDILTSEMKDEAYESADWDFSWLDEPQQRRKYEAIRRGLVDRRGRMVVTFTPLTEPWMKEELVDQADGNVISCFTVDIRDNKFTIQGEPILTEEAITDFEKTISEEYKDARMHGVFFHMRGMIYKEFNEAHQTDFEYEYPDPVICVLDPHDRNPHHLIWAFIDRNDDIFVDYELVVHCELDELAKRIKATEEARGYKMRKRLIDPNFGRKPSSTGANASVIQELSRHGAGFYEAIDNIELGHHLVRDWLHFDRKKEISNVNKPKLFFSKTRVPKTIHSMKNYQYQEWLGKTRGERDPKEMDKDKDTHGADCVRYLVVSRPTFKRLTEEISYEPVQSIY